MLRDASQKQAIQKFSFIESINISRQIKAKNQQASTQIKVDVDRAFNFIPQTNTSYSPQISDRITSSSSDSPDSAIVSTVIKPNRSALANVSGRETLTPELAEIIKYSGFNPQQNSHGDKNPNYLGKILFVIATSYCLFVLWWLFGHQSKQLITQMMGGKYITLSQSDLEFIDYLEHTLISIESEREAQKTNSADHEVVYVPVYTPNNQRVNISSPVPIGQPHAPVQQNQPASPSIPAPLKIPAPPPLPTPANLPTNNISPNSATRGKIAAITKPAVQHTLTGILEFGEGKSAALIKTNGQTRRFWLGEEINDSGWILESIHNQTAKINYQGQIRSIAVGETF